MNALGLDGKVAVLACCGHSWMEDIGSALAEFGAQVILVGESDAVRKATSTLNTLGRNVAGIPTDFGTIGGVRRMVEQAVGQFGKIDILINNFNMKFTKPALDTTAEEWSDAIHANLSSAFFSCSAVGRHMVERKNGSIVNVISCLAERGLPNAAAYCAGLGGVLQLTRSLALEWARRNVRVNAIGVGLMQTESADENDAVARYIPAKRRARSSDITPLVVFLASDASSYLNGNVYNVDGGLMARG